MLCFEIPRDWNPPDDVTGKNRELLPVGITLSGPKEAPYLAIGTEDQCKTVSLGEELLLLRNQMVQEAGHPKDLPMRLDVVDAVVRGKDEAFVLVEQRHSRDNRALVKLDLGLQPGRASELRLCLNVHDEEFVQDGPFGYVVRKQRLWGGPDGLAPKGIGTLVEGGHVSRHRRNGEMNEEVVPALMLEMHRGSSFQIHRDTRLPIPRVIISWDGNNLRWVVPGRYRRN